MVGWNGFEYRISPRRAPSYLRWVLLGRAARIVGTKRPVDYLEEWGARSSDIRLDRHPARTCHAVLADGVVAGFTAGSNSRLGVGRDAVRVEAGRAALSRWMTRTAFCWRNERSEPVYTGQT